MPIPLFNIILCTELYKFKHFDNSLFRNNLTCKGLENLKCIRKQSVTKHCILLKLHRNTKLAGPYVINKIFM